MVIIYTFLLKLELKKEKLQDKIILLIFSIVIKLTLRPLQVALAFIWL